jgi:hypothetical protein
VDRARRLGRAGPGRSDGWILRAPGRRRRAALARLDRRQYAASPDRRPGPPLGGRRGRPRGGLLPHEHAGTGRGVAPQPVVLDDREPRVAVAPPARGRRRHQRVPAPGWAGRRGWHRLLGADRRIRRWGQRPEHQLEQGRPRRAARPGHILGGARARRLRRARPRPDRRDAAGVRARLQGDDGGRHGAHARQHVSGARRSRADPARRDRSAAGSTLCTRCCGSAT